MKFNIQSALPSSAVVLLAITSVAKLDRAFALEDMSPIVQTQSSEHSFNGYDVGDNFATSDSFGADDSFGANDSFGFIWSK